MLIKVHPAPGHEIALSENQSPNPGNCLNHNLNIARFSDTALKGRQGLGGSEAKASGDSIRQGRAPAVQYAYRFIISLNALSTFKLKGNANHHPLLML